MTKVIASCAFPVSEFTKECIKLGKAIDLDIITLEEHESGDIHEKIKRRINECQGILFILEEKKSNDGQIFNFSPWMSEERTIADGLNFPMCIINNSDFNTPDVFPSTFERLEKKDITQVKLISVLNSLKSQILEKCGTPNSMSTAYIRKQLSHRVFIDSQGRVEYKTIGEIESLRDGVKSIRHSIYTQYSACWDATNQGAIPEIQCKCDKADWKIIPKEESHTDKKYSWFLEFPQSLKKHDSIKYGFIVKFPQYFPATKEKLKLMSGRIDYPFEKDRIEHHFFINTYTEDFKMEIFFSDASIAKNFNVTVYNGRIYSQDCVDYEEINRIKNLEVAEDVFHKTVILHVNHPKVGSTYSISWELGE